MAELMNPMDSQVLVCCGGFPPGTSGTPVLLGELFRHVPGSGLVAVCRGSGEFLGAGQPVARYPVRSTGPAFWRRFIHGLMPEWQARRVRRRIEAVARRHRIRRIYAHYPDTSFLVGGWAAAERLQVPLTVYFDILWEETMAGVPPALWRRAEGMARRHEARIVQRADRVFAITEFAVEHLQRKHGRPVDLMPHTLEVAEIPEGLRPTPPGEPVRIHFAGAIYKAMNGDAVERLLQALPRCQGSPQVDLCTPALPPDLARYGHPTRYLSRADLRAAQRSSTILYLPQAFEPWSPEMIRHNLPTKTMEYLCSGRPILVHSPADSYLSWLARQEEFAVVVDRPDPDALVQAIDRLASDTALQAGLVANAQRFARTRDSRIWAERLGAALSA